MKKTMSIARVGKLLFGLGGLALVALSGCEMEVGSGTEGAGVAPSTQTGGTDSEDCDYPHGTVSGTVTDKDGKPLANCEVSLWSCCAAVYRGQTDENGQYSFDCVGDGPYRVNVWCPGGPPLADKNINVEVDEHTEVNFTEWVFPTPSEAGSPDSKAQEGGSDAVDGADGADGDAGAVDSSTAFAQCAGIVELATCQGCCESAVQSPDELEACVAAHCS